MLKRIVKGVLHRCGYQIRRLESTPSRSERTASTYDLVWSEPGRVEQYLSEWRKQLYRIVIDHARSAGALEAATIADAGCGPGYLLGLIHEQCPSASLVGLDFSPQVLEKAGEICPAAEVIQHDVREPLNRSFELVFCTEVLEHLLHPATALRHLLESSSRWLITSVPNGRLDSYEHHINYWSLESWQVFLEPHQERWDVQARYARDERNIVTVLRRL